MHCRTRSSDEIVAYMHDQSASASKRPNNSHEATPAKVKTIAPPDARDDVVNDNNIKQDAIEMSYE